MIRCTPKGLCSWDFYLDGDAHHASLEFNWLGEQGAVTADGRPFDVHKHGMLSGHWTLDAGGQPVASAQKVSPFTRTFEIRGAAEDLVLEAESAFGRGFVLRRSGEVIATMRPVHPFTRRAAIDTSGPGCDFPTRCFAFWLVVLTWRRSASSSSAGAAGGAGT